MSLQTQFADMHPEVRMSWLKWADRHDWGAGRAFYIDRDDLGFALRTEAATFVGDEPEIEVAYHKTPAELRAWAGY
jgi:hypothetical protein